MTVRHQAIPTAGHFMEDWRQWVDGATWQQRDGPSWNHQGRGWSLHALCENSEITKGLILWHELSRVLQDMTQRKWHAPLCENKLETFHARPTQILDIALFFPFTLRNFVIRNHINSDMECSKFEHMRWIPGRLPGWCIAMLIVEFDRRHQLHANVIRLMHTQMRV